jgi:uncharacterized Zn-binding protein involved in type VI secretion
MGKPAARIGDMTAHGGSITVGCPTVLIGGAPAARMGDMTVCPMVTPAPAPVPHVGGPIMLGSTGVFIGGMPAARMGDMAMCVGPPSTIALGCMTVLIGEAGGGAGGGGGAAAAAMSGAASGQGPHTSATDTHFLDVSFLDKAKFPIVGLHYSLKRPDNKTEHGLLTRRIKRTGIQQGNYEIALRGITNARWSKRSAKVGDTIDLIVDTVGVDAGRKAELVIYIRDTTYADHPIAAIQSQVRSDQVREQWKLEVDEKYLDLCNKKEEKKRYSQPFFFYTVSIDDLAEKSGLLYYEHWVEVSVKDEDGKSVAKVPYRVTLPSGEVREGKLDASGKASIKGVPPGNVKLRLQLR